MGRDDKHGGDMIPRKMALVEDPIIPEMRKIITQASIMMIHLMKRSVVSLLFLSIYQYFSV
jgi:hypothetical protein